jgi:hypothetical protein
MKQQGMLHKFWSEFLALFKSFATKLDSFQHYSLADTHGTFCQTQKRVYFRIQTPKLKAYAVILQTTYDVFMNEILARGSAWGF